MVKAVQISDTEPESHDASLAADLYRLQSWYKKIIKMSSMDSDKYQQFVQTVMVVLERINQKNDPCVKETILSTVIQKQVQRMLDSLKEKEENSERDEKFKKMESEVDEIIPKNIRGNTPLVGSCYYGYTDIVQWLLRNDVDVDQCRDDGNTGLIFASQNGHTDIVKLLLEKDPNVDLCDKEGCSPLFMASQEGHTAIVNLLLKTDSQINLCNKYGFTPLIMACGLNHTNTVKLLMKHKPNINAQTYDGGNALYFSAVNGNMEITKLLLENNADCNIFIMSKQCLTNKFNNIQRKTLDKEKQELFDSLVKNTSSHGTDYVRQKSVDYGFDVVAGSSPLHIACFIGRIDVVHCLLDHNANINIKKEDGTTPLFYACEVGHEHIVHLLLEKGADTQMCRLDGESPLKIATDNGHTSIVVMLLNHIMNED
ncbi:ankyrin-3-like [Mytilus californianus]|uniref:ankyrin-3-like n=1 Tax=Mytilus californianus TaxID=6549 RepID=UPI00224649AF|nr:ankyrin-3-like [Mytilus californianus]